MRIKAGNTQTEDRGQLLVLASTGVSLSLADNQVGDAELTISAPGAGLLPEQFGAVGDGTTDDTAALLLWAASGLSLSLVPGKTYMHSQQLTMATPNQVIDGRGATLKRMAQAVTTTTTTITSGVTNTITVAATSGGAGAGAWRLKVGDQIVVEQGGSFDVSARTISSIVGNVVTVTGTFGVSLSGTMNVRHGWNQLVPTGTDQRVTNLTLDGNSANWSWGRWQHTCGLESFGAGRRLMVDNCRIINQYGDGVTFASVGSTLSDCDIEVIKGRGFVFAGGGGNPVDLENMIVFNRFVSTNLDTAVGGSDGTAAIDFSQGGPSSLIQGNTINGGVDGIEAAAYNNGHITITGNTLINLSGMGVGPASTGSGGEAEAVIVSHNRFYNCGIQISTGTRVKNWVISDNIIYRGNATNGAIFMSAADRMLVRNNIIYAGPIGPPPELISTGAAGGGTFAAGTYYYKITATNDVGESTPSAEVSATVPLNGRVILTWDFVPGATGYKVYRAASAGAENVSPALVATITGSTTFTVNDTGAAASAGAVPASDTTQPSSGSLITASGLTASSIEGNAIVGGGNGIIGSGCTDLRVDGNTFLGQTLIAYTETDGSQVTQIINNTFVANANSGSAYTLLKMSGGASQARGNRFDCGAATSAIGVLITASNAVFENNYVTGGASTANIFNNSGGTGVIIRNNVFDKAVADTGTNTIKRGNRYTSGILAGRAVLVAGTVTVATTEVKASDNILLSRVVAGGTLGQLSVGTITAATNFVINSDNAADTSTVYWEIVH